MNIEEYIKNIQSGMTGYIYFESMDDFKQRCKKNIISHEWEYGGIKINSKDLEVITFPAFFMIDSHKEEEYLFNIFWRKVDYKYFLNYIKGDISAYEEMLCQLNDMHKLIIKKYGNVDVN